MTTTVAQETNLTAGGVTTTAVSVDNLYPAIVQCFVIMFAGYLAARTDIISSNQSKGIGTFVSKFCLPALLFKNMCVLDFSVVNWLFLCSILIAKSLVFAVVLIITMLVKRPLNYGYAGLLGIFATQSNDFALGYPILQALYENSHPEYLNYIYLIAPISVVFLNPIGFILLELQERKNLADKHSKDSILESEGRAIERHPGGEKGLFRKSNCLTLTLHVAKGVLTNPIVFMTVIGIVGNFIFGHKIPAVIDGILKVLGDAFSASALFFLGLSLMGKVQRVSGIGLIVPLLLIAAKSLILPLVTWQIVGAMEKTTESTNNTASLSMFGFLYGTFPTAPSVFLYASHYNTGSELVATGMVAGTLLSAPIMFVSAKMLTVVVNSEMDYKAMLQEASFDTSIISVVCTVWVILLLMISKRYRKMPHQFILCFIVSHLLSCVGMIIYNGHDNERTWRHYIEFTMIFAGTLSARCWTAILSLVLYLLHGRSLCFVLRKRCWFYFAGFGVPLFCNGLLFIFGNAHVHDEQDPSFHYGTDQTILVLVFLLACSVVNIVCMVLTIRSKKHKKSSENNKEEKDEESRLVKSSNSTKDKQKPKVYRPKRLYSDPDPNPATLTSVNIEHSGSGSINLSHESTDKYSQLVDSVKSVNGDNCGNCSGNCVPKVNGVRDFEDIVPFPSERDSLLSSGTSSDSSELICSLDDQVCTYGTCDKQQRRKCAGIVRSYNIQTASIPMDEPDVEVSKGFNKSASDPYQMGKVLVLIISSQVSMILGIFLCLWRLCNKFTSGIYIEIEFLDTVFNYGQGFLVFAIFGFDTRFIIIPCLRRWRRLVYGAETVHIPDREDLNEDITHLCDQFVKYHMQNCMKHIVCDKKFRMREYKGVFTGTDMCDWLLDVGLVKDRDDAIAYGRSLLIGQLICHVIKEHHFHDMPYFYRFINEDDEEIH